jgi:hypothetical protein
MNAGLTIFALESTLKETGEPLLSPFRYLWPRRYVLSVDAILRAQKPSDALCIGLDWDVCDEHHLHNRHGAGVRIILHRTPLLAMDFLERDHFDSNHDCAGSLSSSLATASKTAAGASHSELEGFFYASLGAKLEGRNRVKRI